MNKRGRKQTATTVQTSEVVSGILNRLAPTEAQAVLRILLQKQPGLTREVEAIATEIVSSVFIEDVADDICIGVTNLDMDDLNSRAGRHSWGYVEPAEAAEELLEEAVAEQFNDMKRRIDLGLDAGAEVVCAGIVLGLFRASREKSGGVLDWAPDFPADHAGYIVEEYLAKFPPNKRRDAGDRLLAALEGSVPEWSDMISGITKRS